MEKITYNVQKDVLLGTEIPKETRTYKPVSHEQLINLTLDSIEKAGFSLDSETYSSAREGKVANGKFLLRNVADKEMQIQVAFQNSYDKTLSLKYAIGARVFICKNGMVHGDMGAFKKKHQGEIQDFTPKTITEYIKKAGEIFTQMQKERDKMKEITVSKRLKAELIGRALIEEEFITSTQLNIINGQFYNPTFNYGSPDSLWELYQFTTQSMRDIHPTLWMENHMKAHKFFVSEAGVNLEIAGKPEIIVPIVDYNISPNQLDLFVRDSDFVEVKETV